MDCLWLLLRAGWRPRVWLVLRGVRVGVWVAGLLAGGALTGGALAADGAAPSPAEAAADELEIGSGTGDASQRTPWIPGAGRLPRQGAGVGLPEADPRPAGGSARPDRRVAVFDFEETNDVGVKLGRGVPLPPGWYAVGRPPQSSDANFQRLALHADLTSRAGFPPYNPVGYSARGAGRSASNPDGNDPEGYALHLGLQGGNSAAFVQVGRLPVVPGTRYRLSAAVCTEGLTHAGARVVAYFIDAQGKRLRETVRQTARIRTAKAWSTVELVLDETGPRAAYLGLQVELVQPVANGLDPLGEHQVVPSDVTGDAWFDDVEIEQLPQARVVSDSPVGAMRSRTPPGWSVAVRDLRGTNLVAELSLYDARARRVAFDQRPLNWGAADQWRWAPPLPAYGYYRAVLRITGGEGLAGQAAPVIAHDTHAVLWLPPAESLSRGGRPQAMQDLSRFALLAEDVATQTLEQIPDLVAALGLRSAVISAMARDTAGAAVHARAEAVGRYLDRAESNGLRTEVSLYPLPDELYAGDGPGATAATVLGGPAGRWFEYVQPLVAQDGARVAAWHPGGARGGGAGEVAAQRVAALIERLRHWTPDLLLVLPGALTGPRPAVAQARELGWQAVWPAGLTALALGELAWTDGGGPTPTERGAQRRWVMHLPPVGAMGQPERMAQAALRVVAAWEQEATGVALDRPWVAEPNGDLPRLTPDPAAAAVAQTARHLVGYRAAGRLPLAPGLRAVIFRKIGAGLGSGDQETGLLVAWNEQAPAHRGEIEVAWGPDVRAVDVWGNPVAVDAMPQADVMDPDASTERRVRVPLGDGPVFITGVDARLLAFRAGFGIDQPLLVARQTPHPRMLRLSNPWPVSISGSLTFAGPAGWEALPSQQNFTIPAGQTAQLPVTLRFPVSTVAGRHTLTVRTRFTARGRHDLTLSTPLELGLPGLSLEPQLTLERGEGQDRLRAVVHCVVLNRGTQPVSLGVFATLPGHPRQERLITRLGAGEAVRRRFVFEDAAAALRDYDVSVGLRETGGAGVLNARVGLGQRGAGN